MAISQPPPRSNHSSKIFKYHAGSICSKPTQQSTAQQRLCQRLYQGQGFERTLPLPIVKASERPARARGDAGHVAHRRSVPVSLLSCNMLWRSRCKRYISIGIPDNRISGITLTWDENHAGSLASAIYKILWFHILSIAIVSDAQDQLQNHIGNCFSAPGLLRRVHFHFCGLVGP